MSDNNYKSSKPLVTSSIKIGTPVVDTSDITTNINHEINNMGHIVKHKVVCDDNFKDGLVEDSSISPKENKNDNCVEINFSGVEVETTLNNVAGNVIDDITNLTNNVVDSVINMDKDKIIQQSQNVSQATDIKIDLDDMQNSIPPTITENMNINSSEEYDSTPHARPVEEDDNKAIIKIIGIGGGGCNALNYIKSTNDQDSDKFMGRIDYYVFNTDVQDLKKSKIHNKVQIGDKTTKGLGAGANQNIGEAAAEESIEKIREVLAHANMVFLTAGMGGGTGTGAIPVVARVAKELGILTVAVVTKPFSHEGKRRNLVAEEGIIKLSEYVDSLIVIPNDKLTEAFPNQKPTLLNAFGAANDVLFNSVSGISEMISIEDSLINIDFNDVQAVMTCGGRAMIGIGCSEGDPDVPLLDEHGNEGDTRDIKAIKEAMSSPLLENTDFSDAQGILVSMIAGPEFMMAEFNNIMGIVRAKLSESAVVVNGVTIRDDYANKLRVTIVAAGLKDKSVIDTSSNQEQSTLEITSGIGSIKIQNEIDAEREREARQKNRAERALDRDTISDFNNF